MHSKVMNSFKKLEAYCENEEFKGWDPYDGLNSRLFQSLPFLPKSRLARLVWIQTFKRSPLNLRGLARVEKEYNAKGLGLFLSGYCKRYVATPDKKCLDKIDYLSSRLLELENKEWSGSCWGYNFDWQARAFYQPKNTPTVVASVFVASALLDAYEVTQKKELLDTARSTCNFILKDLNRTYNSDSNFCFSYSPLDKSVVFNASLLGSRLLSRVFSYTQEKILVEAARKSVVYCCDYQKRDGSWSYGTLPYHQWIDNFHTGYNLECIDDYMKFSRDYSFKDNLAKGFEYYSRTFFTKDGIPAYYSNSTFPIDIHSTAQYVITIAKLNKFQQEKEVLNKVLNWTIDHMQSKRGYFYYQINKYFSSKIPYMRWAQAWMFYALSTYLQAYQYE